jgi:hypothetical protein
MVPSLGSVGEQRYLGDDTCVPGLRGRLRLIATLHDPGVIRKILAHLGRSPSEQSPGPAQREGAAV